MGKTPNNPRFYPPLMLIKMVQDRTPGTSCATVVYDGSDPGHPGVEKLFHDIIDSIEEMMDV